ncbi:MAG: hypothetical protein ACSLFF_08010 [Solirubrobacterales bacterium]
MSALRSKLTFANVVSLLALFVALGGTSYAVTKLPKNSVGAKQLRKSAVTSFKVKDRSLLEKDFKAGQIPAGAAGAPGPRGPSDGFQTSLQSPVKNLPAYFSGVLSMPVPAGNYFATATVDANTQNATAGGLYCRLIDGFGGFGSEVTTRGTWIAGVGAAPPFPQDTLTLVGEFKIPPDASTQARTLNIDCSFSAPGSLVIGAANIVAIQLESVSGEPG